MSGIDFSGIRAARRRRHPWIDREILNPPHIPEEHSMPPRPSYRPHNIPHDMPDYGLYSRAELEAMERSDKRVRVMTYAALTMLAVLLVYVVVAV